MSTGIVLREGLAWENLPQSKAVKVLRQDVLAVRLAGMRREWEQAANGMPLEEVQASVGLMLEDFAAMMELEGEMNENDRMLFDLVQAWPRLTWRAKWGITARAWWELRKQEARKLIRRVFGAA